MVVSQKTYLAVAFIALCMFIACISVSVITIVDITELLDDALAHPFDLYIGIALLAGLIIFSQAVLRFAAAVADGIRAMIGIDARIRPLNCVIPAVSSTAASMIQKLNI